MSDAVHSKPEKKRRGRWWKIPVGTLLLLLTAFAIFRFAVHQRVQNRLNAIRAAGYPVTLEELNAWYAYPEGPNAADVYQKAFEAMPDDADTTGVPIVSSVDGYVLGQRLDDEMRKRIEDYLAQHTKAIALLEEASRLEDCRFAFNLRDIVDNTPDHYRSLRSAARVLLVQSILDADRRRYDLAADRCEQIIALAQSIEDEPILASALVGMTIQDLAIDQIESLVSKGSLEENHLDVLFIAIDGMDLKRMTVRSMIGDRCIAHMLFNDQDLLAKAFFPEGPLKRTTIFSYRAMGLLDIYYCSCLDVMRMHIDLNEHPAWPLLELMEPQVTACSPIPIGDYANTIDDFMSSMHLTYLRHEAKRRAVLVGLAAERYRQEAGVLPAELNNMMPAYLDSIPNDPFDGKPIRYTVKGAEAVIYSIGNDRVDNGGHSYDGYGYVYKNGTDITFTIGNSQEKLWPRGLGAERSE